MRAKKGGMELQFASPLAAESVSADRFAVKVWGLRRTKDYGSPHVNEHPLAVASASLSADGKTVWIALPDLAPTWGMEIKYSLRNARNEAVQGTIHNTVHRLP